MGPSLAPESRVISFGGSAKVKNFFSTLPTEDCRLVVVLLIVCLAVSVRQLNSGCPGKGLFNVSDDVVDMFNTDRQSNQPLTYMTLLQLLRGQLRMGR